MKLRPYASVAVAGLLVIIAVAVWMMSDRSDSVPTAVEPGSVISTAPIPDPLQQVAVAMPAPPIPPDLPPPKPRVIHSPEALKDIEDIQFMLRDYRTRLGDNPTGTNAEIMKEIMGGNRVQAKLGPPEGQKLNDEGELLDRWGAPYFFHQLSKNEMEIRSSGPDRAMWTNDDIVVK
jgi:hypothetical protein